MVSHFFFSRTEETRRIERGARVNPAQTTGDKQRRVERFMLSARNTYWGCLGPPPSPPRGGLLGFLRRVGSRVKRILFLCHYVIAARVAAGRQTLYRRRGREAESFVFQHASSSSSSFFFYRECEGAFRSVARRDEISRAFYKGNSIARNRN